MRLKRTLPQCLVDDDDSDDDDDDDDGREEYSAMVQHCKPIDGQLQECFYSISYHTVFPDCLSHALLDALYHVLYPSIC